jgi:hypothetical protein
MAHLVAHAPRRRQEPLIALSDEWTQLDGRVQDLRKEPPAHVTVDWIVRRQSAIREAMIETPAATMAGVCAKHRVATAQNDAWDEDLLESAESDVVRLVYA